MLEHQIKEEIQETRLVTATGLYICWLIQLVVYLPTYATYRLKDTIFVDGDNTFLIIMCIFSYFSNFFVLGFLSYYLSGKYLRKKRSRQSLKDIQKTNKFKIFLLGNNYHFKGRYNYKVVSSKQKAIFPVESQDFTQFDEIIPCGKIMSLYDIKIQIEFADEKTKFLYFKLHNELRERNTNRDRNFDIEYSYDFDNFSNMILVQNTKFAPFVGIVWFILFTFILPLGAFYQTYLFFVIERKRFIFKKLIRREVKEKEDESNEINIFDVQNEDNVFDSLV